MMKLRKNMLIGLLAGLLAFAGVACDDGTEDADTGTTDTGTGTETTDDPGLEEDPALEEEPIES